MAKMTKSKVKFLKAAAVSGSFCKGTVRRTEKEGVTVETDE